MPLRLYPVPPMLTWEIVTLVPPVFVTVSDNDELFPTITLPKLRLAGLALSVPSVTPVPDKGIVKVGFEPLDVMVTDPVALPAVVGANLTLNVAL